MPLRLNCISYQLYAANGAMRYYMVLQKVSDAMRTRSENKLN